MMLRRSSRLLAPALVLLAAIGPSCSDDGEASPASGAAGETTGGGANGGANGGAAGGSSAAGGSGGASGATATGGTIDSGGGAANSGGAAAGSAGASSSPSGVTADAGLGGADGSGGNIQRCEFEGACLEFRDHAPAPACQESNAANCTNLFAGTYAEGPCPPEYEFREVETTFCGPTATFALPSQP